MHLLYAHFTHTLRNFTQFNALYARPDYFTQLYAHGNLLMNAAEILNRELKRRAAEAAEAKCKQALDTAAALFIQTLTVLGMTTTNLHLKNF